MTSIKMLLSYNNNQKVIELPVVPDNLPDILQELENSTIIFVTLSPPPDCCPEEGD